MLLHYLVLEKKTRAIPATEEEEDEQSLKLALGQPWV